MDSEIQLISDGEGLAVIGDPLAVEQFLVSEGLSSTALGMEGLRSILTTGASVAEAGSEIAANSGRWVKLTEESAKAIKKYGLRESSTSGLTTGVLKGTKGQVRGFVEFARRPGSLLTNPAILAGAAGIMAQVAMQQTMDEITDYLATINEKVDDILRAQKDDVLSRMTGVGLIIEESMTLREKRGRVDDITWSKVQFAPAQIAETQAYALRQLDGLAEKMQRKSKIGELADTAKEAESESREWLAVLARCFYLQDAIAILELDRVLDASPDELNAHRLGLRIARQHRLDRIAGSTGSIMARMDAAASRANQKVLLHPTRPRDVVNSSNQVGDAVTDFHRRLGIEFERQPVETRRWANAAADARDQALETGAGGVQAARRLGNETLDRTKTATVKVPRRIADEVRRRRGNDEEG